MPRTLSAYHDAFPLRRPFRISRGEKTVADVVTVEISAEGATGRGEGVPYPRYGESILDALHAIGAARAAIEAGATRQQLLTLMPAGAARNAVDCALWDLDCRLAGKSMAQLLGRPPLAPLPTAITIGLDQPPAMAAAAKELADVPLLKVKVNRDDPAALIRAVREAAPRPRLIVDPNESWTMADVAGLQPLLAELRVDLLEQPLPADSDDELAGFSPLVPIAADESAHGVDDLARLAGRYQRINIKLDKTGGLTAALQLAAEAKAAGLGLMVGCMICSSLSIAPALWIAGEAEFADLDGPLWLASDRFGGVTARDGLLQPPEPGFWGAPG